MWPFKRKKNPEKYPILELHGIFQKLTFVYRPELVFQVINISYDFVPNGSVIRIEAVEL